MGRRNGESITANTTIMTWRPTNVTETYQYPAFVSYRSSTHVPTCLEARVHTHRAARTHSHVRTPLAPVTTSVVLFANTRILWWVCASIHVFSRDCCASCTEPAYMQWKHACSNACSSVHALQIGTHVRCQWCACQLG